jgi:hypothetical protein
VRKSAKDSFGAGSNKRGGAFRCPRQSDPIRGKRCPHHCMARIPSPPIIRLSAVRTFASPFGRITPRVPSHSLHHQHRELIDSPKKKALAIKHTIIHDDDPLSCSDIIHHFQECCTRILGVTTFRLVCLGKIRRYLLQPRNRTNPKPTASRGADSSFSAF